MNWKKYGYPMFVFEADKGAGSGGGTSDGDGTKTGQENNQQNGGAGNQNAGGENGAGNQNPPADQSQQNQNVKTFTQDQVNQMITERLARENKKREDESRAKQGEFEPLYTSEKAAREAAELQLTTVNGRAEKYAGILNQNIDTLIANWPDEVKALDPGKTDLEVRQNWVEKSQPLAKRLLGTQNQNVNGEHGPKNGTGKTTNIIDDMMAKRFTGPAGIKKAN